MLPLPFLCNYLYLYYHCTTNVDKLFCRLSSSTWHRRLYNEPQWRDLSWFIFCTSTCCINRLWLRLPLGIFFIGCQVLLEWGVLNDRISHCTDKEDGGGGGGEGERLGNWTIFFPLNWVHRMTILKPILSWDCHFDAHTLYTLSVLTLFF